MATGSVFEEGGSVISSSLTRFLVQLILIVAFSRILGFLIKPLKQPLVIAEVIAGILLGPSAISKITEFKTSIFPTSSLDVLGVFANVGLILFLFIIGLEAELGVMTKSSKSSIAISISGILVPFGLGCGISNYIYDEYSPDTVPRTSFILFIGVAMAITAFPVLARILSERKLLGTSVGMTTLGAAAIDDIVAWCILALVVSIIRASDKLSALYTVLCTIGLITFLFVIARPVLIKLYQKGFLTNQNGISHSAMVLIYLFMFTCAWMTEWFGIHAIFGGFAVGLIIPRQANIARTLCEKTEDLVVIIFLPLYFTLSGLKTDLGLISSGKDGGVVILIILFACLGKFGGCTLAARACGNPWRKSVTVGVLMNTKGLVEIVVLNIGLDNGVITSKVFTMCIIMALVTTFMTTPICAIIYPRQRIVDDTIDVVKKRHAFMELTAVQTDDSSNSSENGRATSEDKNNVFVVAWYKTYSEAFNLLTICSTMYSNTKKTIKITMLGLIQLSERPSSYMRYLISSNSTSPEETVYKEDPMVSNRDALMERAHVLEIKNKVETVSFPSTETVDDVCDVVTSKKANMFILGFDTVQNSGTDSQTPQIPYQYSIDFSFCGASTSLIDSNAWLAGRLEHIPSVFSADPHLPSILRRVGDKRNIGIFINKGLGSFVRKVIVPYGSGSSCDKLAVKIGSMMAKSDGTEVVVVLVNNFASTEEAASDANLAANSSNGGGLLSKLTASNAETQQVLRDCSLKAKASMKVIHNDASANGSLSKLLKEKESRFNDVLVVVPADLAVGSKASYLFKECPYSLLCVYNN